jgi:hypothetical protein
VADLDDLLGAGGAGKGQGDGKGNELDAHTFSNGEAMTAREPPASADCKPWNGRKRSKGRRTPGLRRAPGKR